MAKMLRRFWKKIEGNAFWDASKWLWGAVGAGMTGMAQTVYLWIVGHPNLSTVLIAMAIVAILVIGAIVVSNNKSPQEYIEIANQQYLNCEVLLDGHIYLACNFTNVTFVYDGGDSGGFDGNCIFAGSFGFRTSEPKVGQMLGFLKEIKMLRPNAFARYTQKSK